jgi:hypothetical protein
MKGKATKTTKEQRSTSPPAFGPDSGGPEALSLDLLQDDPANDVTRYIAPEREVGLGNSMDRLGDVSGIVWNETTGQLVAGHQRMRILKGAGAETWTREGDQGFIVHPKTGERFPIRIVQKDEDWQRLANITANNPHIAGEFTPAARDELRDLAGVVGYDALNLSDLYDQLEKQAEKDLENAGDGDGGGGGDGDGGERDEEEGEDEMDELSEGFAVVVECGSREEADQAGEYLREQGRAFRPLFGEDGGGEDAEVFEWPFEKIDAPEGEVRMRALQADPRNPRVIDEEELQGLLSSVTKFGDLSGITWNERTGKLVTGHQRLKQLRARGATKWVRQSGRHGYVENPKTGERFGIRIVSWDDQTAQLARITANNPHIQGRFTTGAGAQLRQLQAAEDFAALGLPALMAKLEPALKRLEAQASAQASEGYCLLVECASEAEQRVVVELVLARGYKCRALI